MSKRAALYLRLSRALDRDPETGQVDRRNLPMQKAELEAEATRRGFAVTVFEEAGVSAYKETDEVRGLEIDANLLRRKRPVFFTKLWSALERGEYDVVMATEVDRLSRFQVTAALLANMCQRAGVTILCPGQVELGPEDDPMIFYIHASIAASESRTKSRRSKRFRERTRQAGRASIGGRRPYGYRHVKGGWAIVENEREHLLEAVERALAGQTPYRIATDFNARGTTTAYGGRWRPENLRKLLTAQHLTGSNGHPAIVTEDEHILLRSRLRKEHGDGRKDSRGRSVTGRGRPRKVRPASGLVYCGVCGIRMFGQRDSYACGEGCGRKVKAADLEQHLRWAVEAYREEHRDYREGHRHNEGRHGDAPTEEQAALITERRALEARKVALAENLDLPEDVLVVRTRAIEDRLRELEDALAATMPEVTWSDTGTAPWEGQTDEIEAQVLHDFLALHIDRVTVKPWTRGKPFTPDRVEIAWRAAA